MFHELFNFQLSGESKFMQNFMRFPSKSHQTLPFSLWNRLKKKNLNYFFLYQYLNILSWKVFNSESIFLCLWRHLNIYLDHTFKMTPSSIPAAPSSNFFQFNPYLSTAILINLLWYSIFFIQWTRFFVDTQASTLFIVWFDISFLDIHSSL